MPHHSSSEPSTPSPSRSFAQHTPEFRLGRSDSKNPASTCRGLTANGRPCRRSIASAKAGSSGYHSMFCWQHRDQGAIQKSKESLSTMRERSSMDSLVSRLGLMAMDSDAAPKATSPATPVQPRPKLTAPPRYPNLNSKATYPHGSRPRRPGFWSSICCMSIDEDDEYRPHMSPAPSRRPSSQRPSYMVQTDHTPPVVPYHSRPSVSGTHVRPPLVVPPPQPSSPRANVLPAISPHLPRILQSALTAESRKPVSPCDEAGYIYIFWLTDNAVTPPIKAAASLLSPTSSISPSRADNIIRTYSTRRKTIMLKIGRANNVHRRMNEWTRQCGQNVSLVRWYPYAAAAQTSADQNAEITKVPHAHRVERLIHMELATSQVTKSCDGCGRQHREWFEVEASERGLRVVDEAVRRWVAFDLGQ